jgi:hypothetical protein
MYLISKDEYEASKQPKDSNCARCGTTISDSHVNNIDASHGGTILISSHDQEPGREGRNVTPHSHTSAGGGSVGMGPAASPSSPSPPSRRRGKSSHGRQRGSTRTGDGGGQTAGTNITTHVVAQPSDAPSPPPPRGAIQTRGEPSGGVRERFRDPSIPPPPSDLRRRAITNSANDAKSIAKKERKLMKQLVEERVDQLTRKKRVDPVGDASQMIHDLREASRKAEKRPPSSQIQPMEVDLVQPGGGNERKKRKEPFDADNINPAAKRGRWGELPSPPSPEIIPRPPPPGRTLGQYGGKKRRKVPADWEYEEYFDPNVRDALPPAKRRPDISQTPTIIPQPPPPGRTLGKYGGKKRRRDMQEWDYEEQFDPLVRDALPPPKRMPDVSQTIIPRPPPPGRTLGQYGGKKRKRDLEEWEYEERFDPNVRDALPPAKRRPEIEEE